MSGEQPNLTPGNGADGPSQFEQLRTPLPHERAGEGGQPPQDPEAQQEYIGNPKNFRTPYGYELQYEETGSGKAEDLPETPGFTDAVNADAQPYAQVGENLPPIQPHSQAQAGGEARSIPVVDASEGAEEVAVPAVEPADVAAAADAGPADIEIGESSSQSESARVFRSGGRVEDDWRVSEKPSDKGEDFIRVEKPVSDGTWDILVKDVPKDKFGNWQRSKEEGLSAESLDEQPENNGSKEHDEEFADSRLDFEKIMQLQEEAKERAEQEAKNYRGANTLARLRELDPYLAESVENTTRNAALYDYFETADRGRVPDELRNNVLQLMGMSRGGLEALLRKQQEE